MFDTHVPGASTLVALRREHIYTGSYSPVYRMIVLINANRRPEVIVPLSIAPLRTRTTR